MKSLLVQFVAAISLFGITIWGWLSPQQVRAQGSDSTRASNASYGARPRHVFLVVLENEDFETTFGKNSAAHFVLALSSIAAWSRIFPLLCCDEPDLHVVTDAMSENYSCSVLNPKSNKQAIVPKKILN